MKMPSTHGVFDLAVVVASFVMYGIALMSTAIGAFWTGPDFDHPPRTGLACLLEGGFWYPISWFANPVFLVGNVCLLLGKRPFAAICGVSSVLLSILWTSSFCLEFPAKLLKSGYWYWMVAITCFAICSGLSWLESMRRRIEK